MDAFSNLAGPMFSFPLQVPVHINIAPKILGSEIQDLMALQLLPRLVLLARATATDQKLQSTGKEDGIAQRCL